jgi:hypothetical protein
VAAGGGDVVTGWDVSERATVRHRPGGASADVVVAQLAGLVVWAGAVTVYPDGFAFTLLVLTDTRHAAPPVGWALDAAQRGQRSWLEIRFADGRSRAADLNANTPRREPSGPHVKLLDGSGSDGWDESGWWVTPLPPADQVELAVHLNGAAAPTGVGLIDGAALASAAGNTETVWPEPAGN